MPRGNVATRPTAIANAERLAKALALRKAGASFQQIADQLGYHDKQTAHRAITNELKKLGREDREDVLTLELARLDDMTVAVWPQARKGDMKAIDTVLRIQDRRARFLGLDHSESRIADAAERAADSAEAQAAFLYAAMTGILDKLDLTPEQREQAPLIIIGELERLQLPASTTPSITPTPAGDIDDALEDEDRYADAGCE